MIALKYLPSQFQEWNARWGAPYGHKRLPDAVTSRLPLRLKAALVGPFGFQAFNNRTRLFEYPWAFHVTELEQGQRAVDLGGSLGGFQFVLARSGLVVHNVDPGLAAAMGWNVPTSTHGKLNAAFGTNVSLHATKLQDAAIARHSIDRFFAISTLEHIPPAEIPAVIRAMSDSLSPGGKAVLTVDLFLDQVPFTPRRSSNAHGSNINIRHIVEMSGLTLVEGNPAQLYGFDEFDPAAVLAELDSYLWGDVGPCVAQAFVLQKPSSDVEQCE
ncbi:MAG TPA: hypothetical protein VM345_02510 [Acidimicrobiales bacterium]|nr:hypothetical protein [Acidimicrobiales bacterium]